MSRNYADQLHGDPLRPTWPRHPNYHKICAKCDRIICDDGYRYHARYLNTPGIPNRQYLRVGADRPDEWCLGCSKEYDRGRTYREKVRDERTERDLANAPSEEARARVAENSEHSRRGWETRRANAAHSGGHQPMREGDFATSEVSVPSTARPSSRGDGMQYSDAGQTSSRLSVSNSDFPTSYTQSEVMRGGQSASQISRSSVSRSDTTQGATAGSMSSQSTTPFWDPIRGYYRKSETSTRVSASDFSSAYAGADVTEGGHLSYRTSTSGFGDSSSYGSDLTKVPPWDLRNPHYSTPNNARELERQRPFLSDSRYDHPGDGSHRSIPAGQRRLPPISTLGLTNEQFMDVVMSGDGDDGSRPESRAPERQVPRERQRKARDSNKKSRR